MIAEGRRSACPVGANLGPLPNHLTLMQAYDLVLWGDSLTADMRDWRGEVWDAYFPPEELLSQPLGMGGSTVQVGCTAPRGVRAAW